MTEVHKLGAFGDPVATLNAQIATAYAYGIGGKSSCDNMIRSVSGLLGGIPIDGYLAMNMGGIPLMNDAIGGVELTALQSISVPDQGIHINKGETVTLSGQEAYYYLRGRDTKKFGSATKRLRREE